MKTGMPPPITDPLAMPSHDGEYDDVNLNEQRAIDAEHASISRGMPARNLKQWGMMAAGAVFLGYLAWTTFFPQAVSPLNETKAKQQVQNQPGLIVAQLEAQQRTLTPSAESPRSAASQTTPSNELPGPKAGMSANGASKPVGSVTAPDGTTMTLAELTEKRAETVRASPMEATEVNVPNKKANGVAPDPKSILADSLDKQTAMLEKTLGGGAGQKSAVTKTDPPSTGKEGFLLRTKDSTLSPAVQIGAARRPNTLYQGTIIRLILERSINTDNPGEFRAKVKSDVYDSIHQSALLIPRGSVALGPYQSSILVGEARILLAGSRLILPNGKSINLMGAPASDRQGSSGVPAEIDNHFFEMFRSSFIVGAASLLLPKGDQNISISSTAQGTQTGGSILGTTLYDTIKQIASRNASIKPTGTIDLGEEFTFVLTHDVEMEKYGIQP